MNVTIPDTNGINGDLTLHVLPDKPEADEVDSSTLGTRWKRPRDESISDADVHKLHYVTIDVHQEAASESTDL